MREVKKCSFSKTILAPLKSQLSLRKIFLLIPNNGQIVIRAQA